LAVGLHLALEALSSPLEIMGLSDSEDGARSADPIEWFDELFLEAQTGESFDPARAALATVAGHDTPDVRFVLVRRANGGGFAFYTNYDSPKSQQLESAPSAALAFHWASLGWQVRVRGCVRRLDAKASDAYFAGRPRGSQLAAWASRQSQPLPERRVLEERLADVARRFPPPSSVPRPEFWGGFLLLPEQIEFWRTGDDRLHDRWLFSRDGERWLRQRLQP
jgi:pyridoxamine 5'-phosphate oxidase